MNAGAVNIHATAIVVGTTGLLFVGPAGSGKSSLALACLASARQQGQFAALISDDQVFVSLHGGHVLARRAETIAGRIEIRGTGIGTVETHPQALMHYAILPIQLSAAERMPAEDERFEALEGGLLPLIRLSADTREPLAALWALIASS